MSMVDQQLNSGELQEEQRLAGMIGQEVAEPPVPPKPDRISNEDRLTAEVLSLKAQNIMLEKERYIVAAQKQIEAFDQSLRESQIRIRAFQSQLTKQYGIDFKRQSIEPDTGRIIDMPVAES